jgi:transcriptional regulator with XRE-family HTH domain
MHSKNPIHVKIGREIRKLRIDLDLPRKKLAELSGISITFLGEIERGEGNASIVTLCRISKALGLTQLTIFIL